MPRVVLALVFGVSACSAPSSSNEPTFADPSVEPGSSYPLPYPPMDPPQTGAFPPAPIPIDRDKELLVTNRAILDGTRSDGTRADAPWTFRHLVEELAPPGKASAFVSAWLASWQDTSTGPLEANLPLTARPDVRSKLVCPWLRLTPENACDATCSQCAAEILDLAQAPFRLLAIVNRLDLAETQKGCNDEQAETRFVFVATTPGGGAALPFNAIFEYGAMGTAAGQPHGWHALSQLSGAQYASALEQITRSVTDVPQASLKQLRTSENLGTARGTSWELRQFDRSGQRLVPSALTNTARDAVDGTPALAEHVVAHPGEIHSGDNAITVAMRTAFSTMPRADFRWTAPGGTNGSLDLFGLSTCNGCHAGHRGNTSILPFAHIGMGEQGETIVSRFLSDPMNHQADELAFRERSLSRRLQGQCGSPDASYGGRNGGGVAVQMPAVRRVH